ncbi:GntR family transcriptional regulator [Micromonospora kangleipakensis]|uniref:GntR family transcriptional regulator n=1 Tax=Micromonospora kangleipakensis TaxID=1077942 RepID=UPI003BF7E16B
MPEYFACPHHRSSSRTIGESSPTSGKRIASGEWPPGHKLPSTKALAELYEVGSQSTVRQAITILIETGELYGHQGLGVFVA